MRGTRGTWLRALTLALAVTLAAVVVWTRSESFGPGPRLLRKLGADVVRVQAMDGSGSLLDQGSGVRLRGGWIATNYHVVEGSASVRVLGLGEASPARVARCNEADDLCLLRVQSTEKEGPSGVRLAGPTTPGETVYALGAPEGIPSVISQGLLSGLREVKGSPRLVTSAPLSAGSSGGGLFDAGGRLVGITTAQVANGQDLNLAVPASQVAALVAQRRLARAAPVRRRNVCITDLGTTAAVSTFREALIDGLVGSGIGVDQDCDRSSAELTGEVEAWTPAAGRLSMSYGLHLADSSGHVIRAWRGHGQGLAHRLPGALAAGLLPRLREALASPGSVRNR